MHLKNSNGSKQSEHLYIALQAVDPNSLMRFTFFELHCGHMTNLEGGAIPYFLSFFFVEFVIQSVVQAGE